MFARSYSFILSVIFFMATLVAASPAPWGGAAPTKTITVTATPAPTGNPYQCHTGPIQCCKQVQKANDGGPLTALLNLLEIAVHPLDALVGAECSPLSLIGVGQATCTATAVCCQNNNVGGLISIGCIPIFL